MFVGVFFYILMDPGGINEFAVVYEVFKRKKCLWCCFQVAFIIIPF